MTRNVAGQAALQLIWRDRLQFIRFNRRLVLTTILVYLAVAAGIGAYVWFFVNPWMQAFIGAAAMGLVWTLVFTLDNDNSHLRRRGAWAEQWTADALTKKLEPGAQLVSDIHLDSHNVDHVVIGPSGVCAVETKWKAGWNGRPLDFDSVPMREAAAVAKSRARDVEVLLASRGICARVRPVLVLWGPGVGGATGGRMRLGRVEVLIGRQAKEWMSLDAREHPLPPTIQERVLEAVRARCEGRQFAVSIAIRKTAQVARAILTRGPTTNH